MKLPLSAEECRWAKPGRNVSGNLWQTQLPANTQPFEYLFYNGQRRLRSRVAGPTGVGYYMKGGSCYSTATGQTVEISLCNLGTFLRVAVEIPPTGADASLPQCYKRRGDLSPSAWIASGTIRATRSLNGST